MSKLNEYDRLKIEDSIEKMPNRFEMILAASARARELNSGHLATVDIGSKANVTALREIANGTVGREYLRKINK